MGRFINLKFYNFVFCPTIIKRRLYPYPKICDKKTSVKT